MTMDKIGKCVLFNDDCLKRLPKIKDNSIDSVVCDPPYNLSTIIKRFSAENAAPCQEGKDGRFKRLSKGFMGKEWDSEVAFHPETWAEVYRVMKPGAHLLAFGGTRTYHRMVCAIEDAGFEIRDQIGWAYGSGFPKSHSVSQSIEKKLTIGKARRPDRDLGGLSRNRFSGDIEGTLIANTGGQIELTTDEAKEWEGWGTALKPAWEPIVVARKPLSEKTVAANVLKWGTGALNIDASRIGTTKDVPASPSRTKGNSLSGSVDGSLRNETGEEGGHDPNIGRWPANLIHDGSDEVVELFPYSKSTGGSGEKSKGALGKSKYGKYALDRHGANAGGLGDEGSAARFFYCAKVSKKERGEYNTHATVKPIALMSYLIKLVTPPNGLVLDPFMGSGSTGLGAIETDNRFVGIELEQDHYEIAKRRIDERLCSTLETMME